MEINENTISELNKGNEEAFDLIFNTYYKVLCNISLKIVKDNETAEEIVQDFFVNFWENHKKLQIHISLKAYLYKSIFNNSIRYIKNRKIFISTEAIKNIEHEIESDCDELAAKVEWEQKVHETMNQLPPKCKEIFILSRFEKLKYTEIAEKLDISIKTVEAQITKALKFMHENLSVIIFLQFIFDFYLTYYQNSI